MVASSAVTSLTGARSDPNPDSATSAAAVIAAEVAESGFGSLRAPVRLVTALDATIPYSQPMEDYVLPDEDKIVAAVREVLGLTAATARP